MTPFAWLVTCLIRYRVETLTGEGCLGHMSKSSFEHAEPMSASEGGQAPQHSGTLPPSRAACDCWLSHLQLMAVQPACLRARPHQLPLQQHQPHQQVDLLAETAAVDGLQGGQHERNLLLHVQADLTDTAVAQSHSLVAAPVTVIPGTPVLPLKLPQAVLDLLILTQHMQVLHQAQYDLLQLVLHQQDEQSELQPCIVVQPQQAVPLRLAETAAATELQGGPASLSRPGNSSEFTATQYNTNSTAEAAAVPSQAIPAAAGSTDQAPLQSTDTPRTSNTSGSSWTVPLNLRVAFAAPPYSGPIDYLHLVLTVRDNSQQEQQVQAAADAAALHLQASVAAEVPLLVLPAVAQQEVQQLLLPAMRQEVQAEQQQQQQEVTPASPHDLARESQLVEHTVWAHFANLASDISLAVQLSRQTATDAGLAVAAAPGPAVNYAAAVGQSAATTTAADGTELEDVTAVVSAPAAALDRVAVSLLYPLLLPFLAAHGLHNLLQMLISCLPEHLQQQWQEQELLRLQHLQHLTDTAPNEHRRPGMHEAQDVVPADAAAAPASPSTAAASGRLVRPASQAESSAAPAAETQQQHQTADTGFETPWQEQKEDSSAAAAASASAGLRHRPKQRQQQLKSQLSANLPPIEEEEPVKPSNASSAAAAAGDLSVIRVQAAPWHSPITQFDPVVEQRYIAWKEQSLSYLDYFAALFGVMYLVVLLKRSYSEPTSLFYCLTILIKVLPHVPLILGFSGFFFRHRELLLFSVAPVMLATFIWFLVVQQIGAPEELLPQKAIATFWSSHGEIATSAMRPFTQHMRLGKYVFYCLIDATIMVWVFGQVYGLLPALERWGSACSLSVALAWGLDLYMRRSFVTLRR